MGIGNAERGDDGVGMRVAARFKHRGWRVLKGATAPENLTAEIRKLRPDRLVLVDAADMKLAPGEIRRIDPSKIRHVGLGTHMLPLYLIVEYMAESAREIIFIGIQPKTAEFGDPLSPEAKRAGEKVIELVREDRLGEITPL